jgi:allantoate deiminase
VAGVRDAGTAALVLARCDELAALTDVSGEITRPYGTGALALALDRAEDWMHGAGLMTHRDAVANVVGRVGMPGLPTFLLASHLDSVRDAGRYDGPLGVLVALAALERLHVAGERLPFAVELVAFADEEGLRFRSSYLASRVFSGLFDEAELGAVDDAGISLAEAVAAMGGDPGALAGAARARQDLAGYLEVHIEQGPVLEDAGLPIGIVTAIAGQSRGFVDVVGSAGHAGNTPPRLRRDALLGAAEIVLALERAMLDTPGLVATVGKIESEPNVGNVIPGRTTLSYDVRHQDDAVRQDAVDRLRDVSTEICARRGLDLDWRHLQDHSAVPMAPRFRTLLARAVEAAGIRPFELPSGAGHDAVSVAHLTDVSMLFVRCRGGVSHHPDESVTEADVAVAIDAVSELLRLLAQEPAEP